MNDKIDSLISKMQASRAQLDAALRQVTPQMEIYPSWKLKQVMDHITGWDELVVSSLNAYILGEAPPVRVQDGIHQYNDASISGRKALSFEQSGQAFNDARARVLQTIRELSPEMLTQKFPAPWGGLCTISSIVKIFVSHELEHAQQIKNTLNKSTEVG